MPNSDAKKLIKQQIQQEKDKHDSELLRIKKQRNFEQERHQKNIQNLNSRKKYLEKINKTQSSSIKESNILLENELRNF